MGSSNENSAYGPVRNPWDRTRVPGGSSGGSAAAVAAGRAPWAIGTDTGGSIRQPAALCGIVGLKPTYGAVSRYGMIAFASSLDQAGPFARDVTDAALLLGAMAGHDPCDSTSLGLPEPVAPPTGDRPAAASASACPRSSSGEGIEPGVLRRLRGHARRSPRELGAEVDDVQLPHAPHALAAYYLIAPAEARRTSPATTACATACACRDGDLLGDVHARRARPGFGAEVKRRIMLGTYALSSRLLRRLLRPRAEGPHADRRATSTSAFERVRLHRHADRAGASPSSSARRPPTRSRCTSTTLHGADVAGRHPGHLDPQRARARACRPASSSPARRSARTASSTRRTRSSRRSASTAREARA